MVKSCEEYSASHNLTISTHTDIKKCKTKCMAFINKRWPLMHIKLNGKNLPWVDSSKHLGVRVGNMSKGLSQDMMEKRALYVHKVNEIIQEFHFADPSAKIMINNIFNTSFFGSQLWDWFNNEAERLENSWNISQRVVLDIPRNTHRYFLKPLSGTQHIQFSLYKRFIKFIVNIKKSKKPTMRHLQSVIKHDCRSTTGRNLRKTNANTKEIECRRNNDRWDDEINIYGDSDWRGMEIKYCKRTLWCKKWSSGHW